MRCERCEQNSLPGGQSFTCTMRDDRTWTWDVAQAESIIKASGRQPVSESTMALFESVKRNDFDRHHLQHVNIEEPVIAAHVRVLVPGGERWQAVVIDGTHRVIARAIRNLPDTDLYILTQEESERCLMVLPDGTIQGRALTLIEAARKAGSRGENVMDAIVEALR